MSSGNNAPTNPLTVDPSFTDDRVGGGARADGDDESTYGSDLESYTTSLASKATDYKFVLGRRYHSYEEGRYLFPNDEAESDRLDVMHQVIRKSLGDKLFTAPITAPQRVLDIGTGTGIWAIEFGDEFPQADVMGNDLSPIQPRWVPPNVHFEVDDVEKPWTYSRPFDFIHLRGLYCSIIDWPGLVRRCYEHTAPGGYVEFTDWDGHVTSPDGTMTKDSAFAVFNSTIISHFNEAGIEVSPGPSLEKWVKEAGFDIVSTKVCPLPFGMWAADKQLKEVGAWNYMQVNEGLESFAMYVLHVKKGWTKEEVDVLCARARNELKDRRFHSMMTAYNVVGRKSASATTAAAARPATTTSASASGPATGSAPGTTTQ